MAVVENAKAGAFLVCDLDANDAAFSGGYHASSWGLLSQETRAEFIESPSGTKPVGKPRNSPMHENRQDYRMPSI
jgi:hypothetical protein